MNLKHTIDIFSRRQIKNMFLIYSDNRLCITKTCLFKYTENFITKKGKFSDKKNLIFFIFLLKTDCGYTLEPPRRGGSNEYPQSMFLSRKKKNNVYPVNPSFTILKWG